MSVETVTTSDLAQVAPHFVDMAHEIVWASVATVDTGNRPRSRVLHPIWVWDADNATLTGWVGTGPTKAKRSQLGHSPYASVNYWAPSQDTCTAECRAELVFDPDVRRMVWDLLKNAPPPVGYDPAIIPVWTSPEADTFAALKLEPYRLRVMRGEVMIYQRGTLYNWKR